jgi:hypothetical protein
MARCFVSALSMLFGVRTSGWQLEHIESLVKPVFTDAWMGYWFSLVASCYFVLHCFVPGQL